METANEKHEWWIRGNGIDAWKHENRGKVGESGFSFHVVISFLFPVAAA